MGETLNRRKHSVSANDVPLFNVNISPASSSKVSKSLGSDRLLYELGCGGGWRIAICLQPSFRCRDVAISVRGLISARHRKRTRADSAPGILNKVWRARDSVNIASVQSDHMWLAMAEKRAISGIISERMYSKFVG